MSELKVSVIVAIHGVERFLKECLDSLDAQDFKFDYEIICVNDTPNDSSPEIIDTYVTKNPKKFKRLDVFNRSLSFTRNDGLKEAKGDYVVFIDGDDFVSPKLLSTLYECAIKSKKDVTCFNYYFYKNGKNKKFISSYFCPKGIKSSKKSLKMLMNDIGVRSYAWLKFIKRDFLIKNQIRFIDNNKVLEDGPFTFMVFSKSDEVNFIKDRLYFYRVNDVSITNSWSSYKAVQLFLSAYALEKIYASSNNKKYYFPTLYKYFFFLYMFIFSRKEKNVLSKKEAFTYFKRQFRLIKKEVVIKNTPWEKEALEMLNGVQIKETIVLEPGFVKKIY